MTLRPRSARDLSASPSGIKVAPSRPYNDEDKYRHSSDVRQEVCTKTVRFDEPKSLIDRRLHERYATVSGSCFMCGA